MELELLARGMKCFSEDDFILFQGVSGWFHDAFRPLSQQKDNSWVKCLVPCTKKDKSFLASNASTLKVWSLGKTR